MSTYKGFYKLSRTDRIQRLKENLSIQETSFSTIQPEVYEKMIENAITTFELPMGVAPNFYINNKEYVVPMVTEEPSVIAAASNAASIIKRNGGFKSQVINRIMRGEIIFSNPKSVHTILEYTENNEKILKEIADRAHPSIVKRGGGIQKVQTRVLANEFDTFVVLDIFVDTQEAMGANIINTILEKLKLHLESELDEIVLMAILSNNTPECTAKAMCEINPETLKFSDEIVDRIVSASKLSFLDPFRCATHNKGIMNGIDAVVMATGNDWRAVNAGIYTAMTLSGTMMPITTWSKTELGYLRGEINIPLALGSVGGSIGLNPKVQLAYDILNINQVSELMEVVAAVGLGQNFAALYALTTDGIQKGHMTLHARNVAMRAGATPDEVPLVTKMLLEAEHVNSETAAIIIQTLRK